MAFLSLYCDMTFYLCNLRFFHTSIVVFTRNFSSSVNIKKKLPKHHDCFLNSVGINSFIRTHEQHIRSNGKQERE